VIDYQQKKAKVLLERKGDELDKDESTGRCQGGEVRSFRTGILRVSWKTESRFRGKNKSRQRSLKTARIEKFASEKRSSGEERSTRASKKGFEQKLDERGSAQGLGQHRGTGRPVNSKDLG